jgi:hypothetical protein
MADLSITAANVAYVSGGNGVKKKGIAGGTITAGMPLYVIAATGKLGIAANTSAVLAECVGIAMNSASDNQPVNYQDGGTINPGATVGVGKLYVLSAAGLISPVDDVTTGDFVTYLGAGITAATFEINLHPLAVAAAADVT